MQLLHRHDQPKQLYLRELRPGPRKLLCRPRLPESLCEAEADIVGPCPVRAAELGSFYECLRQLDDPRKKGHRLASTIVATFMGASSYQGYENVCKKLTRRQCRATHCQQKTVRFITQDLGGDCIFGLKGNQSGILGRTGLKLSPFFPFGKRKPVG